MHQNSHGRHTIADVSRFLAGEDHDTEIDNYTDSIPARYDFCVTKYGHSRDTAAVLAGGVATVLINLHDAVVRNYHRMVFEVSVSNCHKW